MVSLSPLVTVSIVAIHFLAFLLEKALWSKRKLVHQDLMSSLGETFLASSSFILGVNNTYLYTISESPEVPLIIAPVDPILVNAFYCFGLWLYLIYNCLRRARQKRRRSKSAVNA